MVSVLKTRARGRALRMKVLVAVLSVAGASGALAGVAFSGGGASGNLSVWRINESTGQVSLCSFDSKNSPASCAPWSRKNVEGSYGLIVGNDVLSVWRINRKNGLVSQCEYQDIAKEPVCTPWG